jgi:3-phenylpropionate/cinnamic acid dioxygenase small subunit
MTPTPPPLNPSQAVERIREIIVGRHLDRLEQRVARLETTGSPAPAPPPAPTTHLEDRLFANEAQLEALKDNVHRFVTSTRDQTEMRLSQQREDTQRLAAQIQQVAALKSSESPAPIIHQLEQKIGSWLTNWQNSFHLQLNDRDQRLTTQIRDEVATLWENTEAQITRLESRAADRDSIEERFSRIALAARALAECASPTPIRPGPTPP